MEYKKIIILSSGDFMYHDTPQFWNSSNKKFQKFYFRIILLRPYLISPSITFYKKIDLEYLKCLNCK